MTWPDFPRRNSVGIYFDVFKHLYYRLPDPFLMFNDFHVEGRECKLVTHFDILG